VADEDYSRYSGRTVFFGAPRSASVLLPPPNLQAVERTAEERSATSATTAMLRERLSAPWIAEEPTVSRVAGSRGAGWISRRLDQAAVEGSGGQRELHLLDRVEFAAPVGDGRDARVGDRFLLVVLGERVGDVGRVIVPRGVIQLDRVGTGRLVEGVLIAKFGAVEEGALVIRDPEEGAPRAAGAIGSRSLGRPESPTRGAAPSRDPGDRVGVPARAASTEVEGEVTAITSGAVLPTLQHVVLINASSVAGVVLGDSVLFFSDGGSREAARTGGEIAAGVVLRSTPLGASVLITRQSQPVVRVGTVVRVLRALP